MVDDPGECFTVSMLNRLAPSSSVAPGSSGMAATIS
jgi:hypothetical protein